MESQKSNRIDQETVLMAAFCYLLIFVTLWLTDSGYEFMRIGGIVVIGLLGLVMKIEHTICLIALLQPFEYVFKIPGSYTVMPILILICVFRLFMLSKKMLDASKLFIYIVLLGLSVVASFLYFGTFMSVLPFFAYLLFFVLCLRDLKDKIPVLFNSVAVLFVISSVMFCLCSLLFTDAVKVIAPAGENVYFTRFYGFSTVWDAGRMIVVAVSFIISLYLKRRKHLLIAVGVSVLLMYFLVLTELFSALLGLAIILLLLPFVGSGNRKQHAARFLGMLFFVILAGLAGYFFVYRSMATMRGTVDDNGRFAIWSQYLSDFVNKLKVLFIGVGGGNISRYASFHERASAHNIVIEKMMEFGLIGLGILIPFLVGCFRGFELRVKNNLHLLPLIAFLGTSLTQGTSGSELLFILMIVCMIPRTAESSEENKPAGAPEEAVNERTAAAPVGQPAGEPVGVPVQRPINPAAPRFADSPSEAREAGPKTIRILPGEDRSPGDNDNRITEETVCPSLPEKP